MSRPETGLRPLLPAAWMLEDTLSRMKDRWSPHSWSFCRFYIKHEEHAKFHIVPMSAASCVTEH